METERIAPADAMDFATLTDQDRADIEMILRHVAADEGDVSINQGIWCNFCGDDVWGDRYLNGHKEGCPFIAARRILGLETTDPDDEED